MQADGPWRSLVSASVWGQKVAGSNPAGPTDERATGSPNAGSVAVSSPIPNLPLVAHGSL